jgi:hypothetical protein
MCSKKSFFPIIAALILGLWLTYLAVLGSELFGRLYKEPCAEVALPLVVAAFVFGCAAFFAFCVFRGLAGTFDYNAPRTAAAVSLNSRLAHFAHVVATFLCLVATTLALAQLASVHTSVSVVPVIAVALINTLNIPLNMEQCNRHCVDATYDEFYMSRSERRQKLEADNDDDILLAETLHAATTSAFLSRKAGDAATNSEERAVELAHLD